MESREGSRTHELSALDAPWLQELTVPQRQAVTHVDGALLVLAGPGSGKTRVITRRVAYLISQGIPAWQILALTFTNKAAGEMRKRVEALVPTDVPGRRGLVVSTFHTFAAMLLRRHLAESGLKDGFVIHDTADQREAMKRVISESASDGGRWTPASALAEISRLKNQLIGPEEASSRAADFRARAVARLYAGYQKELAKSNAVDFDDLLFKTAALLTDHQDVRALWQERFRYLMVDEYQDTNHAQFVIARQIAGHGNVMVVGDPDQSIYGWRGANIRNILEFEETFPGAKVIPLGENFRSTAHIVDAAAGLISRNRKRRHKDLSTQLGAGAKPLVMRARDEHHEAAIVLERIRAAEIQGVPWRGMAVLYRVNALSRVVEDALRREGIPYQIVRGTAFFERREIKDALAYLRVLSNPLDETSLRRIVNVPPRGIGDKAVERLAQGASARPGGMTEMLRRPAEAGLTGRAATGAAALGDLFLKWRTLAAAADPDALSELVRAVIDESGLARLYAALDEREPDEGEDRTANLNELVSAAAEFVATRFEHGDALDEAERARGQAAEGAPAADSVVWPPQPPSTQMPRRTLDALRVWLESVALVADSDAFDPQVGAVTLMTLHAAKGLEFPLVAIIGLEEGLLPHVRARESDDELEEERRLCFVGMTRAERTLLMTSAATRLTQGRRMASMESQFVRELPAANIDYQNLADDFAAGAGFGDERGFGSFGGQPRTWRGRAGGDDDFPVYRADRDVGHAAQRPEGGAPRRGGGAGGADSGARGGSFRFKVGTMVRHPLFGPGKVLTVTPRAGSTSVRVAFRTVGIKTLVAEYARLEILE